MDGILEVSNLFATGKWEVIAGTLGTIALITLYRAKRADDQYAKEQQALRYQFSREMRRITFERFLSLVERHPERVHDIADALQELDGSLRGNSGSIQVSGKSAMPGTHPAKECPHEASMGASGSDGSFRERSIPDYEDTAAEDTAADIGSTGRR